MEIILQVDDERTKIKSLGIIVDIRYVVTDVLLYG